MISDNKLRIFMAVADCGNFTAAARRLGVSQPAVSQTVSLLEAEAGHELVHRERGKAVLTEYGRIFCGYAERILSLYEGLAMAMAGEQEEDESVSLSLGDGKNATVRVKDGKLEISLDSAA